MGLLATLVILGYVFEDKLHLMAIKELSRSLNARIQVDETNVSFLKGWPGINVELEGLTINPIEGNLPYDIISVTSANFQIDFWSVFTDRYEVSEVYLDQPEIRLAVDTNGELNLQDMFRPERDSTASVDSNDVHFNLSMVRIRGGEFAYRDASSNLDIVLDSLELVLKGDFSAQNSEIETAFGVRLDHWDDGGMRWANNKHLSAMLLLDAQFGKEEHYAIQEGKVKVASLLLDLGGTVTRKEDIYALDLNYASNQNSFASFLSLLPGGLLDTGREYDYAGDFTARGWVRGRAGAGHLPGVHLDYKVKNGAFQYIGYNARLADVAMDGSYHFDPAQPANSLFSIADFRARLEKETLSGHLTYQNFSDPRLQCALKGGLGLEDIRDFYPAFADSSDLKGDVKVDLQVEGRIADFENKNYQRIKAMGGVEFAELRIEDPRLDYPVEKLTGKVALDNHHIQVDRLHGKIGSSDFDLRGTVTEYLPWFFKEKAIIKGKVELLAQNLDLNEWLLAEPASTGTATGEAERFAFRLPQDLDLEIRANVGAFSLADFRAKNVVGLCHLHHQQLQLHQLTLDALEGKMQVAGNLSVLSRDRCEVKVDARITDVDVNKTFTSFHQLAAFALVENHLFGRFSGEVSITGEVDQFLELDENSLISYGTVELRDGKLVNFEPLEGLAGFVKLEELRDIRFSDVRTGYRIDEGFFYIPKLKIQANRYKMEVLGRHGFDNSLDYKVYVEMPRKEARRAGNPDVLEYIDTDEGDPIRVIIPVRITGTVDHPKYALEGQYVASRIDDAVKKQGEELKEGWKTEMEDLFGEQDNTQVADLIDVVEEDKADSSGQKSFLNNLKIKNPLKKIRFGKKRIGKGERQEENN